ncbi:NADH-quinone oxidoreductase subunit NuoE [Motiliproteus sp. SC1-56]|uniref:NADH-quinone oxidoreductase subunit NuoE n=1 Tax=Motiliproteus sp. SC1-56 TaxID=2799565 RepID=UPI001A8C8B47|nr:NADH-quinone oxidoreductase subunit NuoE [Motiliproteus sp. SC1-56]
MHLGPELSPLERQEIEAECAHYPERRAAAIEGLKVVQKHRGWVSDGSLQALAELLQMPVGELEGVATFYNLIFRQPVGRHVILLCDSVCCWIKGRDDLNRRLCQRLGIKPGETSADGQFTLLPTVCLGDCDRAPTLMIDHQQHGNLTPEKIDRLLDQLQAPGGEDG